MSKINLQVKKHKPQKIQKVNSKKGNNIREDLKRSTERSDWAILSARLNVGIKGGLKSVYSPWLKE